MLKVIGGLVSCKYDYCPKMHPVGYVCAAKEPLLPLFETVQGERIKYLEAFLKEAHLSLTIDNYEDRKWLASRINTILEVKHD